MHFYQSQGIRITNLEFIGCGGNQVRHVEEFVVKDAKFEGQESIVEQLWNLLKQQCRLSTALFYPIGKDHSDLSLIMDLMDSLVVQLLLPTVATVDISTKADLKIT